jgi:hypothetical protein
MRAETLKAARRVELARLSQEFEKSREAMKARHASEIAAQRTAWRLLAEDRQEIWSDHRKTFAVPEPEQGRAEQEKTRRDQFQDAASGTDRTEARPAPRRKPDNEQEVAARSNRQGWRARRSAAERKADGSYRERDRDKGDDGGGRTRQRDRHDPD